LQYFTIKKKIETVLVVLILYSSVWPTFFEVHICSKLSDEVTVPCIANLNSYFCQLYFGNSLEVTDLL